MCVDAGRWMRYWEKSEAMPSTQLERYLVRLLGPCLRWIEANPTRIGSEEYTSAIGKLIFSANLAHLGSAKEAHRLLTESQSVLSASESPIHQFALAAFNYRIMQALDKRHLGGLPTEITELLPRRDLSTVYAGDRLRELSRTLEPYERVDPYHIYTNATDALSQQLSALGTFTDYRDRAQEIKRLLGTEHGINERFRILDKGLKLATDGDETFSIFLFELLASIYPSLPAIDHISDARRRADSLQRAFLLAKRHRLSSHIPNLRRHTVALMQSTEAQPDVWNAVIRLIRDGLGTCISIGLGEEAGLLAGAITKLAGQSQSEAELRQEAGIFWHGLLRAQLQLAVALFALRQRNQAAQSLVVAHDILDGETLRNEGEPEVRVRLACAYADGLATAPVELAAPLLEALPDRVGPINDRFTTRQIYLANHLHLIDAAVLAMCGVDGLEHVTNSLAHRGFGGMPCLVSTLLGRPFHPNIGRSSWPTPVTNLAESVYNQEPCHFALHDALLDCGQVELAAHFAEAGHPKGCWALDAVLGKE
jgi:hypothetical protein